VTSLKKNVQVHYVTRQAFAKALKDVVFGGYLKEIPRNILDRNPGEAQLTRIDSVSRILKPINGKCAICGLPRPLVYLVVLSNKRELHACDAHFRINGDHRK